MILLLFLLFPISLTALPILPVQQVEAESVTFEEKLIHLQGNVKLVHEFGILCCERADLFLSDQNQQKTAKKIELHDTVHITFTDGSELHADNGNIDCSSLETFFTAITPKKVVYITSLPSPIKTTSKTLHATIAKGENGYALQSIKGEGAVHIQHLQKEDSTS